MEEARARYLEKKPAAEVDWAIQNARVVDQAAGLMVDSLSESSDHRDRCMADNVDWILAQAPPGSKIVLWAHNGHVSKTGMGSTSMGSHLAKRHGKDYVVLGFAAHKGRYTAVGQGTGLGTHEAPPVTTRQRRVLRPRLRPAADDHRPASSLEGRSLPQPG